MKVEVKSKVDFVLHEKQILNILDQPFGDMNVRDYLSCTAKKSKLDVARKIIKEAFARAEVRDD